jgi:hypothetical protein
MAFCNVFRTYSGASSGITRQFTVAAATCSNGSDRAFTDLLEAFGSRAGFDLGDLREVVLRDVVGLQREGELGELSQRFGELIDGIVGFRNGTVTAF